MEFLFFLVAIIGILYYGIRKLNSTKYKYTHEYKPKSEYERLLQQPEWKEKRLHIIRRDGHHCQYCGATTNLEVHHKYYLQYPDHTRPKPWEYPDTALITLCRDCHQKVHDTKKIKYYYTKYGTPD